MACGLLDNGSQCTIIRSDFTKSLAIRGSPKNILLGSIKDPGEKRRVESVKFSVGSTVDQNCVFPVDNAYVVDPKDFNIPTQSLPDDFATPEKYSHLQGLGIHDVTAADVKLLIGADVP